MLAVATVLLASCGDGDAASQDAPPETLAEVGGDLDRFTAYLGALPGVTDATAEEVELDTDLYGWEAEVVLADDAPSATVTTVLDAATHFEGSSSFDEGGDLRLAREGTEHRLWWKDTAVTGLADIFALAEEQLPELGWVLDHYGQMVFSPLDDLDAITELAARIAGDRRLAPHDLWLLTTSPYGLTGNEGDHALGTTTGIDAEVAAAWGDVAEAAGSLQHLELENLHLVPLVGPGNYVSDPPPEGSVGLSFQLGSDGTTRAGLETGAVGNELHRLVESTVPALAGFPHGSTYSISVWVGEGDDVEEVRLVDLTSDAADDGGGGGTVAGHAHALLDQLD